ncbi:hypothetical protein [Cellulomonas palmilytica]|uniref:hypothetical protein n=1 Tax=Cellulomonas palmilytica TaxID=2608402 RepID=UPI001F1C1E85|nr:hypothetical protein [Cellulomonas palmilytica]UJP40956.1 hypothetical protein F1D97_05685 [Cellulomonas palmilytica]
MTAQTTNATTATVADEREERRRKRAAIVKFSLAGAAVLGIGAAATSATWTDDAWFSAAGSAAGDSEDFIELRASVDGGTWHDADTGTVAVPLPAAVFAEMFPGETRTTTVHIQNEDLNGIDLAVTEEITVADGLFAGAIVTTDFTNGTVVGAGDDMDIAVTVTAPRDAWIDNPSLGSEAAEGDIATLRYTGTAISG